jgi:hypothetical protein
MDMAKPIVISLEAIANKPLRGGNLEWLGGVYVS